MRFPARIALAVVLLAALAGCDDDEEAATPPVDTAPGPIEERAVPPEDGQDANRAAGEAGEGGGEAPSEPPPDPEIGAALMDALMSGDPRLACERSVTESYVQEAYGSTQGCRSAQRDAAVAQRIRVIRDLRQHNTRATAVLVFEGGVYDGEAGDVELVFENGRWRLDSLEVDVPAGP